MRWFRRTALTVSTSTHAGWDTLCTESRDWRKRRVSMKGHQFCCNVYKALYSYVEHKVRDALVTAPANTDGVGVCFADAAGTDDGNVRETPDILGEIVRIGSGDGSRNRRGYHN